MAERRMFTKKVTDDDNFMSLSASAQALYLHLSMSADDDGFCNQVNSAMFKAHASVQDLEALLSKRYLYQFENGVIVIKHWRMANALRKDRYTPTAFQEELKQLKLKDNGAYTMANGDWLPNGCQVVAERLPQNRLDKNSLDKNREDKDSINTPFISPLGETEEKQMSDYEQDFKDIIDYLNLKAGTRYTYRNQAYKKAIIARLKDGFTFEDAKTVIDKKCADWLGTENEQYLSPDTLFRPSKFEKYLNQKAVTRKPKNQSFEDMWKDA